MKERLTADGFCISEECDGYCQPCDYMGKILEKLAHYEDLEEQGRLVVLPEGISLTESLEHMIDTKCPSSVGLQENCYGNSCKTCWEMALKGGAE